MTNFLDAEQAIFAHAKLPTTVRTAGTTRYHEAGSGDPILYVHGGGACGALWAPLAGEISRAIGGRHLMPDRPGFGLTPRVDLRGRDFRTHAVAFLVDFLDALALPTVDVIANSMGGLWSLWLARAAPSRVRSLTLLGAPAFVGGGGAPMPMRLLGKPIIGRLMMALESPSETQVHTLWRRMGHDPATMHSTIHALMLALQRVPQYGAAWRGLMARILTLRGPREDVVFTDAELAALTVPTTILWPDSDPFGPVALGEQIAARCNAAFHVVRGGHLPWLDDAPGCAARCVATTGSASDRATSDPSLRLVHS